MNPSLFPMLFALMMSSIAASVSAFEELGEASLQPMAKPPIFAFTPGTKVHWLKNGEDSIHIYEPVNENSYTVTRDDGCSWTRITNMYARALSWRNCEYASGSQKIFEIK